MAFRLSEAAEIDLLGVFLDGIDLFGLRQAEHYKNSLERCFAFLSDNPYVARQRKEIEPPIRAHPHGSHIIIYLVDEAEDVVILRVRHMHEDWVRNPI